LTGIFLLDRQSVSFAVPAGEAAARRKILMASKVAEVWAYNPEPTRVLTLPSRQGVREARTVRLRSKGIELAAWTVKPDSSRPPEHWLPASRPLQMLTIESDGEERPRDWKDFAAEGDERPYSLSVSEVSLRGPIPGEVVQVGSSEKSRTGRLAPRVRLLRRGLAHP